MHSMSAGASEGRRGRLVESVRRSFSEFLGIPALIIGAFLLLAAATYGLDRADIGWLRPLHDLMRRHVFGDPQSTSRLLSAIAGSIITVTSITFSLLLLALQQSASTMTHEIVDQFLQRRQNQVYFGFFVGLALFTLVTLATVAAPFNPVYGATVALALTVVALGLLLVLIYSTIDQMRPTVIVKSIHDQALRARERQQSLLGRARRVAQTSGAAAVPVITQQDGFVVAIDLDAIGAALAQTPDAIEVSLEVCIGGWVGYHDTLAEARAVAGADLDALVAAVARAIHIDHSRDSRADPAYSVEQLETIGWTSASSSKQDPGTAVLVVRNLRDLLARWTDAPDEPTPDDAQALPVVYPDDLVDATLHALTSLAVVASEGMQHQVYVEVVRAFTLLFERLPFARQRQVEDAVARILPALGDLVLTAPLDAALRELAQTLERAGRLDSTASVEAARRELAGTLGRLNSRSTRASAAG